MSFFHLVSIVKHVIEDRKKRQYVCLFKIFMHACMYVWAFCLHVCLCTTYMPGAYGVQKRVLDPLELELQTVVSHHVDAGKFLLWKSQSLNH